MQQQAHHNHKSMNLNLWGLHSSAHTAPHQEHDSECHLRTYLIASWLADAA